MTGSPRKLGVKAADRIFMRLHNFTLRIRQGEFGDDDPDRDPYTDAGDSGLLPIWLGIQKRHKNVYIELTGMSTEELDCFEKAVTAGIAAARPIVTLLDERAEAEFDANATVVPLRALRPAPITLVRAIDPFPTGEPDGDERPEFSHI